VCKKPIWHSKPDGVCRPFPRGGSSTIHHDRGIVWCRSTLGAERKRNIRKGIDARARIPRGRFHKTDLRGQSALLPVFFSFGGFTSAPKPLEKTVYGDIGLGASSLARGGPPWPATRSGVEPSAVASRFFRPLPHRWARLWARPLASLLQAGGEGQAGGWGKPQELAGTLR